MRTLFALSVILNVVLCLAIYVVFDVAVTRKDDLLQAINDRDFAERVAIKLGDHAKNLEARLVEARHDLELLRKAR